MKIFGVLFIFLNMLSIHANENPRRLADQPDLLETCNNSTYGYANVRCNNLIKDNFFDFEAVEFCKKLENKRTPDAVPTCFHYIRNKFYDEKEFNECVSLNAGVNSQDKISKCLGERGTSLKRDEAYRVDSGVLVAHRRGLLNFAKDLLKKGNSQEAYSMLEKLEMND